MRTAAALTLALLASATQAADKPLSIVQNEYDFVRVTAKLGVRDGFLRYLDKQAVTFAPKPVNGYDYYTGRKRNSTRLDWYPTFALVSASGDFGVDTGPWIAHYIQDGKPQDAYGDWLSIWYRDAAGQWKLLFDGGVDHDKPAGSVKALAEDAKVEQLTSMAGPTPAVEEVRDEITRAEVVFSNTAQTHGPRAAYAAYAVSGVQLLQDGKQALVGLAAVSQALPDQPADLQYDSMGGCTAPSGDLGYVYGMTYTSGDAGHKNPVATYVHVWMHDETGWRLIIAEEQPLPKPSR